ncbi:MAG TPA: lactate permease LctP family transporter [Chitinophagaceae bacterium]|nr:lactate permease LctP family transporter [Chitinophagaceae bacterium]
MPWKQVLDPLNNLSLSLLIAIIPIAFIFWALIIKKMKGYQAAVLTTLITIAIAILVYKMPVQFALVSTAHGALYGLFPICWIIIPAVFLFNITVKSGQFEVIKYYMSTITADRRLQALLIAFSFGAFLEGTAGFGTPVAITAAMLVGLGFNPLYAAGICLIANTAPVAFGSIGIPITVASQVSGLPEMAISQMVGRTLPLLSLVLPFYLVTLMSGFKNAREIWPAILVSGGSFAFFQWFTSNYVGPALPDIIASLASIIALVVFLRFWKPKTIWRFSDEPAAISQTERQYGSGEIIKALSPFIILTIMVLIWGLKPVKDLLNSIGQVNIEFPGLHNMVLSEDTEAPIAQVYKFNYLSAAGTAVFISGLLAVMVLKIKWRDAVSIFGDTLKQLRFSVITIASILGFAYLVNLSGISLTMAEALAQTGWLFPFFAPLLGWLGVFITGSDTSSNALFSKLQATTARSIGVDPLITVGANVTGGVVGKMISPQSIAVAAAAGNLVGKESDLFRFTVKHSFILLILICLITLLQAYVFTWIIPGY